MAASSPVSNVHWVASLVPLLLLLLTQQAAAGTDQSGGGVTGATLSQLVRSQPQAAVQATAAVMCQGGSTAVAWAAAWAQVVQQDGNGCFILVQALAQAKAQCGPGFSNSEAKTSIWKTPLGVCSNNKPQAFATSQASASAGGFPGWFQTPSWFQPQPVPSWFGPGYGPSFEHGHRRMLRGQQPGAASAAGAGGAPGL